MALYWRPSFFCLVMNVNMDRNHPMLYRFEKKIHDNKSRRKDYIYPHRISMIYADKNIGNYNGRDYCWKHCQVS